MRVVDGKSLPLQWTYSFGESSFRQAFFSTDGVSFIVEKSKTDDFEFIDGAFQGRITANITETTTNITFLAVNSGDSRTYVFHVVGENRRPSTKSVEVQVQSK